MAATKIRPTSDPTTSDLFAAIQEVHNCLHSHVDETRIHFGEIKDDLRGIDVRVARMEGTQDKTRAALVVYNDKKVFGLLSLPNALWMVAAAAAAGSGGYKIIWAAVLAVHQTILSLNV